MTTLWNRECYVTVDGLEIRGLRIRFRATKTLTSDPNTLDLEITNLASSTRAKMQKKRAAVIVVAGYKGTSEVIFSGDARSTDHARQGAEWVTHIQCGDGEKAYTRSVSAFSLAPGAGVAEVLKRLVSDLPVASKDALSAIGRGDFELAFRTFQQGFTSQGKTVRELERALSVHGIDWSIQDGKLQLLQGRKSTKESAVLLSPKTGLIGSPDHGSPEKPGMPQFLKMQSLLQPSIRPGRAIRLESESFNGDYRAEKVMHAGDSHGQEWTTSIEARPL
jgi:hypothetical protein